MGEGKEKSRSALVIAFTAQQECLFIIIYLVRILIIISKRKLLVSSTNSNYQFYLPIRNQGQFKLAGINYINNRELMSST